MGKNIKTILVLCGFFVYICDSARGTYFQRLHKVYLGNLYEIMIAKLFIHYLSVWKLLEISNINNYCNLNNNSYKTQLFVFENIF